MRPDSSSRPAPTGRWASRSRRNISRAGILSARWLVGGGRPDRMGARGGYRQHLDDVTLNGAVSSANRPQALRDGLKSPAAERPRKSQMV
jgi:hypothetical protein